MLTIVQLKSPSMNFGNSRGCIYRRLNCNQTPEEALQLQPNTQLCSWAPTVVRLTQPWTEDKTLLLRDIQSEKAVSVRGGATVPAGCLSVSGFVWAERCDAVIRQPGRIWGVRESHERNDAIVGNRFPVGDKTSRARACFIKQPCIKRKPRQNTL